MNTELVNKDNVCLNNWGNAINGALSITAGLAVTQPLFTYKTFSMANVGHLPPVHRLWAGYTPNVLSGAPAEATAFLTHYLGSKVLSDENGGLSIGTNIALSIVAGSLGAPFNAFFEQGMIREQLHGGSFIRHIRDIYNYSGVKGVFKGSCAAAGRDAFFNCGIFAFNDFAKKMVSPMVSDPLLKDFISGMIAGMAGGVLSTPFDLGKTLMQESNNNRTFREIMKEIYTSQGIKGLFRGAFARSLTIGGLICATTMLKERLPNYFPEVLQGK